jgi:hypothetical protein
LATTTRRTSARLIVATPSSYQAFVTDFPSSRVRAPSISEPRIEFVRTHPLSAVGTELEAINWQHVGIGAGFALALVLLGGGAALATRHLGREQTA